MSEPLKKIVVVDDAMLMRRMISDILEEDGFNIVGQASNGEEAVQMAREKSPDLMTMDVIMPLKNGIEATREILAEQPDIKIIVVSSIGQESMIDEALKAGACGYVVKPFRQEDVLETVRQASMKV